jgi:hypothetical protein
MRLFEALPSSDMSLRGRKRSTEKEWPHGRMGDDVRCESETLLKEMSRQYGTVLRIHILHSLHAAPRYHRLQKILARDVEVNYL